jgi:hypothetical protein
LRFDFFLLLSIDLTVASSRAQMAFKKTLIVAATLLGLLSYWLYTPIPDGYSLQSTVILQLSLAALKLLEDTVKYETMTGIINCE